MLSHHPLRNPGNGSRHLPPPQKKKKPYHGKSPSPLKIPPHATLSSQKESSQQYRYIKCRSDVIGGNKTDQISKTVLGQRFIDLQSLSAYEPKVLEFSVSDSINILQSFYDHDSEVGIRKRQFAGHCGV